MKQLGWTTLEQSKKLVESGLDPNTADMSVFEAEGKQYVYAHKPDDINCTPCWSLGALVTLMPKTMKGIPAKAAYHLTLKENVYNAWECNYEHFSFGELYEFPAQPTPIEAAVYTILWLLERGYIKKEETK